MQYRQLLNQLNYASSRYQNSSYGNGYSSGTTPCGTGNMCCDLFVADRCANVWEATCVHACKGKNNGV